MKVSQLYGSRRLLNDVRGLGQSPGGSHLPVSSDHLGPGGPPSLRLGRHRPLELRGQPRVLTEVTQSDGSRAMYGVCELLAPISQAFKNDVVSTLCGFPCFTIIWGNYQRSFSVLVVVRLTSRLSPRGSPRDWSPRPGAPARCPVISQTLPCSHLHAAGDALPLTEDLVQVLGAEHIPQSSLGQQPGGVVGVLNIGHRDGGVGDPVEDHRVH